MNKKLSKLLTIYFLLLIFSLLISCTYPVEPEPEPENPIDCNGYYTSKFREWQTCGCPSCPVYERGTYWVNPDGRMFLLGEPVINPIEVFGKCPTEYIKEIFI
jgi:hypothetical protein